MKGLSLNVCANEEEALNYLFEGETNRTIRSIAIAVYDDWSTEARPIYFTDGS